MASFQLKGPLKEESLDPTDCSRVADDSQSTHPNYSEPLNLVSVDRGGVDLEVTFCGMDRTGMIYKFAGLAWECGCNIVSGVTNRLEDQYSGSHFLLRGRREALGQLHRRIKENETACVDGKRIVPAMLVNLEFQSQDRPGILRDITGILQRRDINIVVQHLITEPDLEIEPTGSDITLWPLHLFLYFSCEIPEEQVALLPDLVAELRQVDATARVDLAEYPGNRFVREQDSDRTEYRASRNRLISANPAKKRSKNGRLSHAASTSISV